MRRTLPSLVLSLVAVGLAAGANGRPPAVCGDGVIQSGEECDDGEQNSDVTPDACRRRCLLPTCGDGVDPGVYVDDRYVIE
jgi:cysteine-rich repeat protein